MKTAAIASLLALGSVSAFTAPSQGAARSSALSATKAEIEGMVGASVETGSGVVSIYADVRVRVRIEDWGGRWVA